MITRESVLKALSHVDDPDLKKDLVSLGMIEDLVIGDKISFTIVLTTPACPMKDMMGNASRNAIHLLVNKEANVQVNFTSNTSSNRKPNVRIGVNSLVWGTAKSENDPFLVFFFSFSPVLLM